MFAARDDVKVLLVSHRIPPEGTAGTETYTADLARALARRGHAVRVVAARKDISLPDLSLRERDLDGIPVHEIVNNLYHRELRDTWEHPGITALFDRLVERLDPDVVHVQHLLYLSVGCVEAAKRRSHPVLFTLHDYWLQCPRFGQRVHADGGICETVDFARCGTCLPSFKFAQSPAQRRVGAAIATVRSATGVDLGRIARSAAGAVAAGERPAFTPPPVEEALAMARLAEDRSRELRDRLLPAVARFLAPSRFLRDRFVREWGIPEDRIEHLPFGVDLASFRAPARTRSGTLRVGFVGSLIPVKGAHVLLDAWGRIPEPLRARGSLVLHGPDRHEPEYVARLEASARAVGARLGGALSRSEVAKALASIDLLVVPSVWFENAPLVIYEALAAGTPLLVSDLGGMAELVPEGRGGWRFRAGDAADLAAKLVAVLEDRSALDELLGTGVPSAAIPTFDEHAAEVEARYRTLVG